MARFSKPVRVQVTSKAPSMAPPDTVNLAGGKAFKLSLREAIAGAVLNAMLQDSYYQSGQDGLEQVQGLVDQADKAGDLPFVAKAALYARRTHGLRSISHVIAGELGDRARGAGWKRAFYRNLPVRPDDVTEVIAYWNERHREEDGSVKRHPNPMLRGLGAAFLRFDAYQLAKWKGSKGAVQLVDFVNLAHIRPPTKGHPIHDLMNGTLKPADTWEGAMSSVGQEVKDEDDKATAKGKEWVRLVEGKKLPYLAAVRNLVNIGNGATEAVPGVCKLLTDPEAVRKCRVFPFQMKTAYDQVMEKVTNSANRAKLMQAVSTAMDLSVENIPELSGKTLIVVDVSGSMQGQPAAIASLFAASVLKRNPGADFMTFANNAQFRKPDPVGHSTLVLSELIKRFENGGGTNFASIFPEAQGHHYDRVIIFSDMQGWMEGGAEGLQKTFRAYCAHHKGRPFIYSFDLKGSGTSQFPEERVALMYGFSVKVFDVMGVLETDRHALINLIDKIDLFQAIPVKGKSKKVEGEPASKE